jgi:hypothetical protein
MVFLETKRPAAASLLEVSCRRMDL